MTDSNQQDFNAMSSALTGIPEDKLAPEIDPIGLPPVFLQVCETGMGSAAFNALLTQYRSAKAAGQTPDQIAASLLADTSSQTAQGARSLMKLWLLGVWYQPYDLNGVAQASQRVVSDQAYKESWAWRIAQAHPMGYSQLHFGYWASEPPPLSAFVGIQGGKQS
ncbi:MAG: sorbitol dehydrogenase [Gammaproteobacteria bacterium HGW-Gammaproteobacteria-11]|nr:MAG: sorbitol dehydrogenase [Gammaproteobacteria bacterium HGW-Gammaproteobacteria-11]